MWIRIDGVKLRDLRSAKGMSAEDLAKKSKVAKTTIVDLEAGNRPQCIEKVWLSLSKALDVRPSELEKKDGSKEAGVTNEKEVT